MNLIPFTYAGVSVRVVERTAGRGGWCTTASLTGMCTRTSFRPSRCGSRRRVRPRWPLATGSCQKPLPTYLLPIPRLVRHDRDR